MLACPLSQTASDEPVKRRVVLRPGHDEQAGPLARLGSGRPDDLLPFWIQFGSGLALVLDNTVRPSFRHTTKSG
jgi:hypothetical protein